MVDNYILIYQKQAESGLEFKYHIKEDIFKKVFKGYSDDEIYIDDTKVVKYSLSARDKKIAYLSVRCDLPEMKSAEILDEFFDKFSKNEHRKYIHIVRSYSKASLTYCCKLMPLFGEFERQIRELLYLTVIKAYGERWFEESFDGVLGVAINESVKISRGKRIETALDELTYEQLLEYIFERHAPNDLEKFFNEINDETFFLQTKEAINNRVRSIRKMSLWERFFSGNKDLEDLESYIRELRPIRNKVMHHKNISKKEFLATRSKLRVINRKLNKAIAKIEERNFTELDKNGVFDSLSQIKQIISPLIEMANWVNNVRSVMQGIKTFVDICRPFFNVPKFEPNLPETRLLTGFDVETTEPEEDEEVQEVLPDEEMYDLPTDKDEQGDEE